MRCSYLPGYPAKLQRALRIPAPARAGGILASLSGKQPASTGIQDSLLPRPAGVEGLPAARGSDSPDVADVTFLRADPRTAPAPSPWQGNSVLNFNWNPRAPTGAVIRFRPPAPEALPHQP